MDTYYWNPIIHVFIWCSILSWFVVLPITSAEGLFGLLGLFLYNGVFYEVVSTANFWFYVPLAAVIALFPVIMVRSFRLDFLPEFVDDVRLKMKKEGRKKFIPKKLQRFKRRATLRRSGYAFSHQEGFADLITSGKGFGMEEDVVLQGHRSRLSAMFSASNPSSPLASKKMLHLPPKQMTFDAPFPVGPGRTSLAVPGARTTKTTAEVHEE